MTTQPTIVTDPDVVILPDPDVNQPLVTPLTPPLPAVEPAPVVLVEPPSGEPIIVTENPNVDVESPVVN